MNLNSAPSKTTKERAPANSKAGAPRQQRIVSQLLMIVQIFVSQGQTIDPLGYHLLHPVFDTLRIAIIGEAIGKLAENPDPFLDLPQQQTAAVAGDRSTVELRPDLASL